MWKLSRQKMALAERRENKVPGEDLSGEQVDQMKLSVILKQREEWGREGGRERESGDIAIIPVCRHGC